VVACACNPSTKKDEARGSIIGGLLGLYSETNKKPNILGVKTRKSENKAMFRLLVIWQTI
jgi:hypothetical protein